MSAPVLNHNDLLTYKEAALKLGFAEISLRRFVSQGKLAHYKIGGKVRFKPEHLQAFIKEVPPSLPLHGTISRALQ